MASATAGLPKPTDDGTTFLVTEGAGKEDGPAFITLNTNSTLKGVVLYYPEQDADDEPKPYPWAIAMRGKNPAVLAVEMLNPYNGIDATQNERHLIRDVQGQPLRRGVLVDAIYDIGRIENVHFNPWWSIKPKLFQWQMAHGEAFIFGRTDWQYVSTPSASATTSATSSCRPRPASATATSSASAPTTATRRWWSRTAPRSAC